MAHLLICPLFLKISNLKLTLERKEAELEQFRSRTNTRGAVSPLRIPKLNNNSSLKPEISQQHVDTQNTEVPQHQFQALTVVQIHIPHILNLNHVHYPSLSGNGNK